MRLALRRFVAVPFSVTASEGIAALNRHPRRAVYVHTVQRELARQSQDQSGNFFMSLYLASASPPFWVIVQEHHNSHWLLEVASIKTQTKSCERETGPLGLRLSFKLSFPHILSRFDVWTLLIIFLSQPFSTAQAPLLYVKGSGSPAGSASGKHPGYRDSLRV